MKKALWNKCLGSLALVVLSFLSAASATQAASLIIEDFRIGKQLHCIDIIEKSFSLTFIHSVSLTPVIDQYKLIEDSNGYYKILQTEERFIAHGQGLPSMDNEPDIISFDKKNGKFIIQLERNIDKLIVRTDNRFKNRLNTGKSTVDLNQWANTGLWIYPISQCPK